MHPSQAIAAGRAGRALGLRAPYGASEGLARQAGRSRWVWWQAWQGSGSMLATMLANKTLLGLLRSWLAAAVAFVREFLHHAMCGRSAVHAARSHGQQLVLLC